MITPNLKDVNFAKEIRGRRLNGRVNRELEVDLDGSCRLYVWKRMAACISCNVEFNEDNTEEIHMSIMQLGSIFGLKHFTEDHEFLYHGIKVISFKGIKLNRNIGELNMVIVFYI